MISKRRKWVGAGLLSAMTGAFFTMLTSCASPYSQPVFDEPGSDRAEPVFDGLLDHAARATAGPLRVGVVHGMCDHDRAWAEGRLELYARTLGIAAPNLEPLPAVDGIERYRALLSPPGVAPLEFIFVVWSPLSKPIKDDILHDSAPPTGPFPFRRARLNGELKEGLLNRCFADAVVYLGRAGNPIRNGMERVTCELLGSRLDEGGICRSPDGAAPVDLVLVTESLGSKVLFDAVRGLRERTTIDPAAAARLEEAGGRTQALYLVSNQVPLLDLAASPTAARDEQRISVPHPSSLADFLTTLEAGRTRNPELRSNPLAKFEIIAFTDPNDLLSYRLLPEELRLPSTAIRLVNVIVSNAPTWLGLVERPDHAHMGYGTNPDVAQLLIRGNHPDTTD